MILALKKAIHLMFHPSVYCRLLPIFSEEINENQEKALTFSVEACYVQPLYLFYSETTQFIYSKPKSLLV